MLENRKNENFIIAKSIFSFFLTLKLQRKWNSFSYENEEEKNHFIRQITEVLNKNQFANIFRRRNNNNKNSNKRFYYYFCIITMENKWSFRLCNIYEMLSGFIVAWFHANILRFFFNSAFTWNSYFSLINNQIFCVWQSQNLLRPKNFLPNNFLIVVYCCHTSIYTKKTTTKTFRCTKIKANFLWKYINFQFLLDCKKIVPDIFAPSISFWAFFYFFVNNWHELNLKLINSSFISFIFNSTASKCV